MDGFDRQKDVHLKKPERHCTEGEVQLVDGWCFTAIGVKYMNESLTSSVDLFYAKLLLYFFVVGTINFTL